MKGLLNFPEKLKQKQTNSKRPKHCSDLLAFGIKKQITSVYMCLRPERKQTNKWTGDLWDFIACALSNESLKDVKKEINKS